MTLRCERGFTLIELLVVIAVAALAAGLVAPSLGRSLPRGALVAAASEIRGALRAAGSTAAAEGRTVVFRPEPNAAGYWIDRQYHRLTGAGNPAARLRIAVAGGSRIAFFAWGGSSGGRIWIDGAEERREIDVDAVSGHASLGR